MLETLRILVGLGCTGYILWIIDEKIGEIKLGRIGSRLLSLGIISAIYYGLIKFDLVYNLFSQAVTSWIGTLEPGIFISIIVLIVPLAGLCYAFSVVWNNRSDIVPEMKDIIYDDIWLVFAAALTIFVSILL